MPFRVTEPCNRFLEASHDPVIRQMRAGPLSDIVGQAVKGFGHSAGMPYLLLCLLVETDCVAGHVRLELGNVSSG
jgi:hypothetical protein